MKDTSQIKHIYETVLAEHVRDNRQMAFLSGPRQCGKTTLAKSLADRYFTWDDLATRRLVAGDTAALSELLLARAGNQIVAASLSREIGVAEKTVKTWIATLEYFHEGFTVRPWFKNVENSIRKTPKWYQRDWCEVEDEGARFENLVACPLIKAVDMWTDIGLGDYALYYVRNKAKAEVDFLVAKNGKPWFLVEAKTADTKISPALISMQKATGAAHAFQVVRDLPYAAADAFAYRDPIAVSAQSFLSQLF